MSLGVVASHAVVGGGTSAYVAAVLADAPAFYGRFGDASSPLVDSSGNGHNGTYSGTVNPNAAGLLTGDANGSLDVTAGNGGVVGASWMSSANGMAFDCIIQPDTVSAGSYNFIAVRDDNNGTGNLWWLVLKAQKLTMLCRGSEFSGATTILPNTKYHVGCKYDSAAGVAKVFVNGAVDGTAAKTGLMSTGSNDLLFGRWGNAGSPLYFDGRIDEAAYWPASIADARFAAHAALV